MKKIIFIALMALISVPAMAQHNGHNCGNCPHHKQHQAQKAQSKQCCEQNYEVLARLDEIVEAFPAAKSVKKEKKWTVVYDAKSKVLGYAVYSKPASDGIKGFNGETPVMIALDANKKIVSVTLLDNNETPGYVSRVIEAGLLKSWNDMKADKALKKKVDTVTGATFSSKSIIETVQATLKTL